MQDAADPQSSDTRVVAAGPAPVPSTPALSAAARRIIDAIDDELLRIGVEETVRLAVVALDAIARLHLPQDNFEAGGGSGPAHPQYQELAPSALHMVSALNALLEHVFTAFPAPAAQHIQVQAAAADIDESDFDLQFDLVDGPGGDASGGLSSKKVNAVLSPTEQVADAAQAFGGMLRSRLLAFGARLQHALAQDETWPLLAELDDYKHRLAKAVQGLLFGVMAVFAPDGRREDILPAYRSAASEAAKLRGALADLTHHVGRFNEALQQADSDALIPLIAGVADRLRRFSAVPEYHTLRADDKKAVIDFRSTLHELRHQNGGIPAPRLRLAVEGFAKFLESMQAINYREVLVLHDRQRLEAAAAALRALSESSAEAAGAPPPGTSPDADPDADAVRETKFAAVLELLLDVRGRSPDLDAALRGRLPRDMAGSGHANGGSATHREPLAARLARWRSLVGAALRLVT